MSQEITPLDIAFIVISLLAIVRLLTYQRDGATFKRGKSLIAWALLCAFAWVALMFITGQRSATDLPTVTLPVMLLLTALIFHSRGNVSAITLS